jgi:hypothetical protein
MIYVTDRSCPTLTFTFEFGNFQGFPLVKKYLKMECYVKKLDPWQNNFWFASICPENVSACGRSEKNLTNQKN